MEVGHRTCKKFYSDPDEGMLLEKGEKYLTRPKLNKNGEIFVTTRFWFWIDADYFEDDYEAKYGVKQPKEK